MKKIVIRMLLLLLVIIIGYLAFNQIDARPYRSALRVLPALKSEAFEKTNGYYRIWTLNEPNDVDIETDAALLPYRRLFDPAFDNDHYIKEFNQEKYKKKYKYPEELKKVFQVMNFGFDWLSALKRYRGQLIKAREEYGFMLDRYEKLINCEQFSDFTLMRIEAPIPNLLAWLHMAKLSIALDIMAAQEGNASKAVTHLLRHLHFATKVIVNSRILITNLIGKAVARQSIWALNNIMNQKDCSPDVFRIILENTPLLSYKEFGSRLPLIYETFFTPDPEFSVTSGFSFNRIKYKLLYQKNRTCNVRIRFMEGIIRWEETPPHLWSKDIIELPRQTQGIFWWLQNPVGKINLDLLDSSNFIVVVSKSYMLKTFYDMLHIAADLHSSFDPARSVQSQLNDLSSYRELLDPCSGKPFVWNEARQILYSIGIDRRDNQGETNDYQAWRDSDYTLPVITFVK